MVVIGDARGSRMKAMNQYVRGCAPTTHIPRSSRMYHRYDDEEAKKKRRKNQRQWKGRREEAVAAAAAAAVAHPFVEGSGAGAGAGAGGGAVRRMRTRSRGVHVAAAASRVRESMRIGEDGKEKGRRRRLCSVFFQHTGYVENGARGSWASTRASASGDEAVGVQAEVLTRESLVAYVRSGCKPRSKWRIGTEHEKFGFYFEDSKRPLEYATIATLLEKISKNFEWDPIMENGRIIGLRQGGQSVTLEPGGQFELSGAPLETIHLTCAEVNSHLYQVRTHKTCTFTEKRILVIRMGAGTRRACALRWMQRGSSAGCLVSVHPCDEVMRGCNDALGGRAHGESERGEACSMAASKRMGWTLL